MPRPTPYHDDPLTRAMQPPAGETPDERQSRLYAEEEARRISDEIDERLKAERERRSKRVVKILLLGQSESGKSTTLKNFQLLYTPAAFRAERESWRAVIHLNLLRSIHTILDSLAHNEQQQPPLAPSSSSHSLSSSSSSSSRDSAGAPSSSSRTGAGGGAGGTSSTRPTDRFRLLRMRLSPLRHAEDVLRRRLAAPDEEDYSYPGGGGGGHIHLTPPHTASLAGEFVVRSASAWKGAMSRVRPPTSASTTHANGAGNDPAVIIEACCEDMIALWRDPAVREVIRSRRLRLEESSGFFLNDIERIAKRDYHPTEDDVLRARLRTVGVQEHRLNLENGPERGTQWHIIDVGGSRSQRASWVPYFDDVNAIIFLAPISVFDQSLAEDKRVNRVEDSLLLWKLICQNKLLANVDLILFLNKCDILKAKLEAGVRLAKYVPSFKDHPNNLETVTRYFRAKFKAIQREYSPSPRVFYGHLTAVTDPRSTSAIMAGVREVIVKTNLHSINIL